MIDFEKGARELLHDAGDLSRDEAHNHPGGLMEGGIRGVACQRCIESAFRSAVADALEDVISDLGNLDYHGKALWDVLEAQEEHLRALAREARGG